MRWFKKSAKSRRAYKKALYEAQKAQNAEADVLQQSTAGASTSSASPDFVPNPLHFGLFHGGSQTPGPSGINTSSCVRPSVYSTDSDSDSGNVAVSPVKRPHFHESDSSQETIFDCGQPVANIPAVHNVPHAADENDEITHGLPKILHLTIGCRVMLRINLWTEVGLVNGSIGTVRDIGYAEGHRPPAQPIAAMIEFDRYNGPTYRNKLVPIIPIRKHWTSGSNSFWRSQLPLHLAHAMTIHKSQGLTLDKASIDIGEVERQLGITYVALSRVKTLQGIIIDNPFAKDRLDAIASHHGIRIRQKFLEKFM